MGILILIFGYHHATLMVLPFMDFFHRNRLQTALSLWTTAAFPSCGHAFINLYVTHHHTALHSTIWLLLFVCDIEVHVGVKHIVE